MFLKKNLELLIAKVELSELIESPLSDMWEQRFLHFIKILKKVNIDGDLNLKNNRIPTLQDLAELYRETNNKDIEYYLKSVPGFIDIINLKEESIRQHGFITMQYNHINKRKLGIIKHINNIETYIYYDRSNCTYAMNYLNVHTSFCKIEELRNLINIIEKEKIIDAESIKIAEMLLI